jgi:hypothetical protein
MAFRRPRPRLIRKSKHTLLTLTPQNAARMIPLLQEAAERARYVSSPYHRPRGSLLGKSVGRKWLHASKCDVKWTRAEANRALKDSIIAGTVSAAWIDGFPRCVWYQDDDVLYEARLSNRGLGDYHAYPLEDRGQWPKNFRLNLAST